MYWLYMNVLSLAPIALGKKKHISLFKFYICLYAFYETNYFQTATNMPFCFRRVEKPIAMVGCSP